MKKTPAAVAATGGKKKPLAKRPPHPVEEHRVLILAPTGNDARLTSGFLTDAGFIVELCRNMDQVCAKMLEGCGTILLAEETLGPESLPAFLDALKLQPSWSDLPITIITGGGEAIQSRLRRLAASGPATNISLLERPFHPETLLSTVEVAMRSRQRQYQVRDLLAGQRASEQRLQTILDSISDAFVALDREWRFTYINKSYMELVSPLYDSLHQLIGHTIWEKFPDVVGTDVARFYKEAMATQKTAVIEYYYAPIKRWLEIHAHPNPEILSLYVNDITGRKQQEATLRELTVKVRDQARIFDTTLSHITDFAYTFDRDGRFIYINKPLLGLWGLTLKEATGKNFHELNYPPDLANRLQKQIKQVFNTGEMVRDETSYTNPEGNEGYYEYIFSPVFDEKGRVEIVAGSTRVITERKLAEIEMRAARARLEATLFIAEVGTWTWDIGTNTIKADKNLARLFFMNAEEEAEGPRSLFTRAIHPEDRMRVETEINAALHSKSGDFVSDYRLVHPGKPLRWVTARGRVQHDGKGEPSHFPGVVIDITERKRQEEELANLSFRIEEQARLFDATLSHIADLAYTFDRDARLIYANKKLLTIWGRTLEESVGKTLFDLNYPKEIAARIHGELLEVVATGKPAQGEVSYAGADGVFDFHEYIFNPVFDAGGDVVAVAGTSRLVTQRRRDEEILRKAKEEAEAANRAKDRFLAVLSHELRTPLTPVLMTIASMEVDPSFPPEARENFTMIRRNVELETKLIDDLLDLSRVASGKLPLHPEPVDLNAAVRHVCSICGPQISEKGVHLHTDLAADAGFVLADPSRFRQVLWNLLNNAVKFTPARKNIHVTTARLPGDRVRVEVRDEGIGIPAEIIPRIFDAFQQGEEKITRQFGGLGLGLAICKALVELHHGTIRVESPGEGAGAIFFIELPGATSQKKGTSVAPAAQTPGVSTLRLLIVEDHVDTSRALAHLLRRSGYLVETAASVAEAIALAASGNFHLMISDLGLPDATGYELMRRVSEFSNVKGIAMSGFGMEEDVRKSHLAGFSEHLVKPVNITHLREAIQRVMGTKG